MSGAGGIDICYLSEESLYMKAQSYSATDIQELCWELSPRHRLELL